MISEMAKQILSGGAPEVEEQTVIFLEAGNESFVFRLFRARESDEDPEQQAIQWLGLAKAPVPVRPWRTHHGVDPVQR